MCTEEDFWIGSHDMDSDRSWEWIDSSPWTYSNWARVEHTGAWWLQNCGHMYALDGQLGGRQYEASQWHIVTCDLAYNFVCEQSASTIPRVEHCNVTNTLCLPTTTSTTTTTTTTTTVTTTTTTTDPTTTTVTTTTTSTTLAKTTTTTTTTTTKTTTTIATGSTTSLPGNPSIWHSFFLF